MTKRGTRLENSGLSLDDKIRSTAIMYGLDPERTWADFWDYWIAVPGHRGIKLDWVATVRNRCRQLEGKKPNGPPAGLRKKETKWSGNICYSYTAALGFRNRKRNGIRISEDEEQAIKAWGLDDGTA